MPKGITISEKQFDSVKAFWSKNPKATYAQATQKFRIGYKTLKAIKQSRDYVGYLKNFVPRAYKPYERQPNTNSPRVHVKRKKTLWEKIKSFFS